MTATISKGADRNTKRLLMTRTPPASNASVVMISPHSETAGIGSPVRSNSEKARSKPRVVGALQVGSVVGDLCREVPSPGTMGAVTQTQ